MFFKVSCPVCQMSLPFLDRIAEAGAGLRIIAVSQDDTEATHEFTSTFKVSHIGMLFDPPPYEASRAFRITSVPSVFVIEPDGIISQAIEGFSKERLHRARSACRHTCRCSLQPIASHCCVRLRFEESVSLRSGDGTSTVS